MSLLSTHPLGYSRLDTITPLSIWFSLLAAPVAFGVVSVLTPGVIAIARWRGWVARPSIDRWHRKTTALMGGIAIYLGTVAATLLLARRQVMPAFAAASSMMFLAGLIDDRRKMSPSAKIIVQLVASAVFVANGHFFDIAASRWFTVPLTVFWLLGITNGVNLIDNMDGLAAGVGAIAAMALGAMALIAKAPALAVVAFAITGSAAGFLLFNFQPARIFMGDCGSLFLGFALASLAVMVQNTLEIRGLLAVLMIAMILGVPILDTTLVTVIRTLNGRPVSQGGRDHTSHRLVALGLSDRQAVLLLYAAAAVFGLLGVVFYLSDIRLRISIIIFAVLAAGLFGIGLGAENVYQKAPTAADKGHPPILVRVLQLPRAIFGPSWKPVFAILVDASILAAAFILAHFLRFEDGLTPSRLVFLRRSLPLVILLRLPVFAIFGLYRAVWRHAGALDILRIVAAATLGTVAAYVGLGLLHGFYSFSRGVLFIDWMAVILALIISRVGFRGLRSYLTALSRRGAPVAVYGAGEDGALTLVYLRRFARELGVRPVAIVDDSKEKWGNTLQGLRVLCGIEGLQSLKKNYKLSELILSTNHLDSETRRRIKTACKTASLTCRTLAISLEPLKKGSV